jgi:hypothetical protein
LSGREDVVLVDCRNRYGLHLLQLVILPSGFTRTRLYIISRRGLLNETIIVGSKVQVMVGSGSRFPSILRVRGAASSPPAPLHLT